SGVGGRPTKSKEARRIRVRLSAGGLGFSSFSSSFVTIKLSTGVLSQDVSFTSGTAGFLTGCHAQCFLLESDHVFCASVVMRGSGAPIFTHVTRSAISASESFFPFGGI